MKAFCILLAGMAALLRCATATAAPAAADADFDSLIQQIRRISETCPEQAWEAGERAAAILETGNSLERRVEYVTAMAPAIALKRGFYAAERSVIELIDPIHDGGDSHRLLLLVHLAWSDLRYRQGEMRHALLLLVKGLRYHPGQPVDEQLQYACLLQAARINLAMGYPAEAQRLLGLVGDSPAMRDARWRDAVLLESALAAAAAGNPDAMWHALDTFSDGIEDGSEPALLRGFSILKAVQSLAGDSLPQAQRFLEVAQSLQDPFPDGCPDGLLLFLRAYCADAAGEDAAVVRALLRQAHNAFHAAAAPGLFPALLAALVEMDEVNFPSTVGEVFLEELSQYADIDQNKDATPYAFAALALLKQRQGDTAAAASAMRWSQRKLIHSQSKADEIHAFWLTVEERLVPWTRGDGGNSYYYLLTLVMILVVMLLLLLLRIHTQRTITESLRESVEKARIAEKAAEHASQLKSRFLSNISHEIKTPMSGLVGMTSLLEEVVTDPLQRKYVDTLRVCSRNLLVLMNDLLDLGRMENGALEIVQAPFQPRETFSYCEQLITAAASEKGLELDFVIQPEVPEWLVGDATRLGQVLVNLLNNAIKFTDAGGIRLSAAYQTAVGASGALVVTVSDTGIGISPERLNTVFEPFNQPETLEQRRHGGSGLGLAITRKLVGLMGGTIRVESRVGAGTTFTISLPFRAVSSRQQEP